MTTYYIDADNGNNANDGLSTGQAWADLDQYMETARAAGDIGILRNATAATYDDGTDVNPVSDGERANPVIVTRDYNNAFGDDVDLSATATATLTWGSKTVTFAADISGVLAVGDWIYNADDDDPEEFAYEVATVAGDTVTLFLPFKGTPGSGKAMTNLGAAPIWSTAAASLRINWDQDLHWIVRGLHLRGGSGVLGSVEIDSTIDFVLHDCIFETDTNRPGIDIEDTVTLEVTKCRFLRAVMIQGAFEAGAPPYEWRDCYADYADEAGAEAMFLGGKMIQLDMRECEIVGMAADGVILDGTNQQTNAWRARLRNCLLDGTGDRADFLNERTVWAAITVEDWEGTPGDYRQFGPNSDSSDLVNPVVQSNSGEARAGGNAFALTLEPSASLRMGGDWRWGRFLLFEHPLYLTAEAHTISVYAKPDDTTDWTANPTAREFYIELEYWRTADHRDIVRSTEVIDMAGDASYQALTITVTPAQAGVAYLRCWWGKARESGNTNLVHVDPLPELT